MIDFVDNTGKHSIASLPNLFGMPKNLKGLKGRFITDVLKKVQDIQEVTPDYPVENIDDWDDDNVKKIIKRVDIFSQAELPAEIKQHSQFSWEASLDGYKLQFPALDGLKQVIKIEQDMLNKHVIDLKSYAESEPGFHNDYSKWALTKKEGLGSFDTLEEALKYGDAWIMKHHPEFDNLFNQDSKWRKDSPTDAQVNLLKKLGIKTLPNGITKGQASTLIGKLLSEKPKRKF